MIRQAKDTDIDAVAATYEALLTYEAAHESRSNWRAGIYPVRATAADAAAAGTLYVLEEDGRIAGSLILNHHQTPSYASISWRYTAPPEKILVAHTLCIPPSAARCGHGRSLIEFAVRHGREEGMSALRLDTWEGNTPAAALYRSLGFRSAGRSHTLFQGAIPEYLLYFEMDLTKP